MDASLATLHARSYFYVIKESGTRSRFAVQLTVGRDGLTMDVLTRAAIVVAVSLAIGLWLVAAALHVPTRGERCAVDPIDCNGDSLQNP
jgi:hypothetical protein